MPASIEGRDEITSRGGVIRAEDMTTHDHSAPSALRLTGVRMMNAKHHAHEGRWEARLWTLFLRPLDRT